MTNHMNQIKNICTPIAWIVMTGEDREIVEDVVVLWAPTNMEKRSTEKNHFLLQSVIYIYFKQQLIFFHCYFLSNL